MTAASQKSASVLASVLVTGLAGYEREMVQDFCSPVQGMPFGKRFAN
jgi:hypothetical protein